MVGLVAAAVERGHDAVADELLHVAAELARDQRRGDAPVRIQHLGDLGRRRALGEGCEPDQVGEEDADVLAALTRRRQVEIPEALVAPLATRSEADDQVRGHDQAVPLPPARVPLALAGDRNADHRLGEQEEAGDDRRRQQLPVWRKMPQYRAALTAYMIVPTIASAVSRLPVAASLLGRRSGGRLATVQTNHPPIATSTAPRSSARYRINHGPTRADVDERRADREHGADQQADRDRDLEAGVLVREEDAGGPDGVQARGTRRSP